VCFRKGKYDRGQDKSNGDRRLTKDFMSAIAIPTPIGQAADFRPDDPAVLEHPGLYELVDGELRVKEMSSLAGKTAVIVCSRLFSFVESTEVASVFSETTFRCFPGKPNQLRRPDVAVVIAARSAEIPEEGHVPVRPDLAIEVVCPEDRIYELDDKLDDYAAAEIPLVWVINPKARTLTIHRPGQSPVRLTETQTVTGEMILPGFAVAVRDLLPARR
jgi:Uma2 family endonuclease